MVSQARKDGVTGRLVEAMRAVLTLRTHHRQHGSLSSSSSNLSSTAPEGHASELSARELWALRAIAQGDRCAEIKQPACGTPRIRVGHQEVAPGALFDETVAALDGLLRGGLIYRAGGSPFVELFQITGRGVSVVEEAARLQQAAIPPGTNGANRPREA